VGSNIARHRILAIMYNWQQHNNYRQKVHSKGNKHPRSGATLISAAGGATGADTGTEAIT
jgi:hypothetical protein